MVKDTKTLILDKIKPKLKYTFNERVESEWNRISEKGSNYYITAYVVDKRTLESELDKYISYIREASKYLTALSKAMAQSKIPSVVWLSSYTKLFKKNKKIYRQFEDEPPEQVNVGQAIKYIQDQIWHYKKALSINFVESIGESIYNTLINPNALLLQKTKIGIGFYVQDGLEKYMEKEILDDCIKKLNRKALEYFVKIPSKVYNHAMAKFKKLSQANIIHIPKVK